jgi:signal transduction histidine kinase
MNAIMGFSDLLQDSNLDNKERIEYLKIIKNSGNSLVSIIEDLRNV